MNKFLLILLASSFSCFATIRTSPSLSYNDVTNTVGLCSFGDTVILPVGTNWWSQTVVISGITLQGQGTNSTVIQDETPVQDNGIALLVLDVTNVLTRVCFIQFRQGVTNNVLNNQNNFGPNLAVVGSKPFWRIDDCQFNYLTGKNLVIEDSSYGVVDHNVFLVYGPDLTVVTYSDGFGDGNWAQPEMLGTSNFVFVEDNSMIYSNNFGATDISQGGRMCFRYNYVNGGYFETHGSESAQRARSARTYEVYNNTFFWSNGQQYNDFYTAVDLRGGTGVVWGNNVIGYYATITLQNYRSVENNPEFAPWYGASGTNCFDNVTNVVAHLTNTPTLTGQYFGVNASTNVLYAPAQLFTPHQYVGYTVFDTNNDLSGLVQDNDQNTLYFAQLGGAFQFHIESNDWYSVYLVYPALDQIGRGAGNNLGDLGVPTQLKWVNEASEPFYNWSNNLSIMYERYYNFTNINIISGFASITEGRDFSNAVPQPGYVPYTYPFPLVTQQQITNKAIIVPLGIIGKISNMHP